MRKLGHLLAAASVLGLSGCFGPWFDKEAGASLDTGHFGNATMNNTMIQSGEQSYAFQLANRFSNETISTVNFAFNSAQLDAQAQQILRQQADWIRQFPEVRFRVYGHTDAVGSHAYNKRLGLRRAQAVVAYLARHGIGRDRLEAVASLGETQPLIVTQGREPRNRRTITQVVGFAKGHTGQLDGKYASLVYREYVASATSRTTLSALAGTGINSN